MSRRSGPKTAFGRSWHAVSDELGRLQNMMKQMRYGEAPDISYAEFLDWVVPNEKDREALTRAGKLIPSLVGRQSMHIPLQGARTLTITVNSPRIKSTIPLPDKPPRNIQMPVALKAWIDAQASHVEKWKKLDRVLSSLDDVATAEQIRFVFPPIVGVLGRIERTSKIAKKVTALKVPRELPSMTPEVHAFLGEMEQEVLKALAVDSIEQPPAKERDLEIRFH